VRIEWSRCAHADLDWIEHYIAQDNPIVALETRERIERQVKLLKQQPRMGRKGRVPGTRELVITALPYIVIYRVKREAVQIARILHGAQMWPR